jgi:hypothetical protein
MHAIFEQQPRTVAGRPPAPPHHPLHVLTQAQHYFHHLVDELIVTNKIARAAAKFSPNMPPNAVVREFGTVHCNIGRDAGKTSYIKDRAKAGDLIVVVDRKLRDIQYRSAPCLVVTAGDLSARYDQRLRASLGDFATVYIDEPAAVFRKVDRDEVYYQLARSSDQTFVLLGE